MDKKALRKGSKRMPISKFKLLHFKGLGGRQQQATLVAQRFGLPRNLLLAATSESTIEAWRTGKPEVLARRDGSKLVSPSSGNTQCAELRTAMAGIAALTDGDWKQADQGSRRLLTSLHKLAKKALK